MKNYNIREAAIAIGVKVRTIRDWIANHKILAHKDENNWYWVISEDEIERVKNEYGHKN